MNMTPICKELTPSQHTGTGELVVEVEEVGEDEDDQGSQMLGDEDVGKSPPLSIMIPICIKLAPS